MVLAILMGAVSLVAPGGAPATPPEPPSAAGALRRALHFPKLKRGPRCPVSATQTPPWTTGQKLIGPGPVYLMAVVGASPASGISIALSARDNLGRYAQKTPWAIDRSYGGPMLVRGARIDRRGAVRFAFGHGQHLRELYWNDGADQGLPPEPRYRFLPSETLFRAGGCYAFQVDGTSFSRVIVVRVRR